MTDASQTEETIANSDDKYYNFIDPKQLKNKYVELNEKGLIKPVMQVFKGNAIDRN